MFTAEELAWIDRMLIEECLTPQEVAEALRMPHSTFRSRLLASGKRIKTSRQLEDIQPVRVAPPVAATQTA